MSKVSLAALVTRLHPITAEFCQLCSIESVPRFHSPLPACFALLCFGSPVIHRAPSIAMLYQDCCISYQLLTPNFSPPQIHSPPPSTAVPLKCPFPSEKSLPCKGHHELSLSTRPHTPLYGYVGPFEVCFCIQIDAPEILQRHQSWVSLRDWAEVRPGVVVWKNPNTLSCAFFHS